MNREIKFKAWDIGNNNWLSDKNCVYLDDEGDAYIMVNGAATDHLKIVHAHICLYTGLKDKNGKEIYEGDIVTGKAKNDFRWPMRGKVEFINGGFAFNVGQQSLDNDNDYYCYPWTHDDFEVIGNIYEHSHLLKTEQ
jgi:uncharacterized phage protein (TIGR01671 family)